MMFSGIATGIIMAAIYLVFFVLMTTVFIVSSILHHYGYL